MLGQELLDKSLYSYPIKKKNTTEIKGTNGDL